MSPQTWSYTSQRNINSTFELHDGLKPIYARILVVLSRPTARAVSDIFFFFVTASLSLYGHEASRRTHAQTAVSYTPHAARGLVERSNRNQC